MKKQKAEKVALSPLERAIRMHKLVIKRHNEAIENIRACAEERIAERRRKIDTKKILLDALERGALKP